MSAPPLPPSQLRRLVLAKTLQHPLTLYPTATGVLGLLALGLFGPTAPVLAAVGAGLGVGLGSFGFQYLFRGQRVATAYLAELARATAERRRRLGAELEKHLASERDERGVRAYVEQALQQFHMIGERFETFQAVLDSKVERGELTHGRFLVTGEQVYLAVLDALQGIASRLHGIRAIDPFYVNERLAALKGLERRSGADDEEERTLLERRALRERQLERINELLTFNETALTKFDEVNAAVAEMRAASSQATLDLESATAELQSIVERARRLSGNGQ